MSDAAAIEPTDEQLVEQARQGCAESFEWLVERHQVSLVRFLVNRTGAREDAEDLAQETFVRAYQNLHRYRATWRFSTWLFTIARRLGMNHARRRRPASGDEALATVAAAEHAPDERSVQHEERRRLWDLAAEMLSEEQVTALWLHYVDELPTLEIARVLGCTRMKVKTMLFRARKKLLPSLQALDGERGRRKNVPLAGPSEVSHV